MTSLELRPRTDQQGHDCTTLVSETEQTSPAVLEMPGTTTSLTHAS
jgi:hypothetical protein